MAEGTDQPAGGTSRDGAAGPDGNVAAIEKLKADLRSLRADLEAAAQTVNQLGTSAAQEAMAQAQEQMNELRDQLEDLLEEAKEYGNRSAEAVRQHVQERPFASLAIAVATGFVLAHLISRR